MAPNYQLIFALVDVDEQLQMQRSKLGGLLGSELMLVHGLGKFLPAVATLFYLAPAWVLLN